MKKLFLFCNLFLAISLNTTITKAANFKIANGDVAAFIAAIEIANANNQPDTIFMAYRGTYTFSTAHWSASPFKAAFVVADDGLNPINKIVIYGNGSIIERDLNAAEFRIVSNIGNLELNDLYLKNGRVPFDNGAGISNAGKITLNRCTLTDHSGAFFGGALYGGLGAYTRLVNCTITACSASFGSAIYFGGADADVINCTITKNTCWGNTGKVAVVTATATLDINSHIVITNSIIADNRDGDGARNDAGGGLRSGSGNLIGAIQDVNTTNFIFSDQTGTSANPIDPQLGALGYYGGGLVPTIPLASAASPAYGKASAMFAPALDQIGTNRLGAPSRGSMEFTPTHLAFLKPKMQVLNEGNLLVDGSGEFTFPNTLNGQQSALQNFVIKNNSNSIYLLRLQTKPVIILTGADAADFTVSQDTIRTEFAPLSGHAITAFQIKFTPKSLGAKTATVSIPSNDIDHPVYQFDITGEAVAILPVELLSFNGQPTSKGNLLKWQTLSEKDNAFFEVWRIYNNQPPKQIGKIKGSGTTSVTKTYQFLDQNPAVGINYYELKQIDVNGESKSHGTISVKNNLQAANLNIYTTEKSVEVDLLTLKSGKVLLAVYNLNGKKLYSKETFLYQGQNKVSLPTTLGTGVYLLQIKGEDFYQTVKFIK